MMSPRAARIVWTILIILTLCVACLFLAGGRPIAWPQWLKAGWVVVVGGIVIYQLRNK